MMLLIMKGGTIMDAAIIDAPSSTQNVKKERESGMHQTKKGKQWQFGTKLLHWHRRRNRLCPYNGDYAGQCS